MKAAPSLKERCNQAESLFTRFGPSMKKRPAAIVLQKMQRPATDCLVNNVANWQAGVERLRAAEQHRRGAADSRPVPSWNFRAGTRGTLDSAPIFLNDKSAPPQIKDEQKPAAAAPPPSWRSCALSISAPAQPNDNGHSRSKPVLTTCIEDAVPSECANRVEARASRSRCSSAAAAASPDSSAVSGGTSSSSEMQLATPSVSSQPHQPLRQNIMPDGCARRAEARAARAVESERTNSTTSRCKTGRNSKDGPERCAGRAERRSKSKLSPSSADGSQLHLTLQPPAPPATGAHQSSNEAQSFAATPSSNDGLAAGTSKILPADLNDADIAEHVPLESLATYGCSHLSPACSLADTAAPSSQSGLASGCTSCASSPPKHASTGTRRISAGGQSEELAAAQENLHTKSKDTDDAAPADDASAAGVGPLQTPTMAERAHPLHAAAPQTLAEEPEHVAAPDLIETAEEVGSEDEYADEFDEEAAERAAAVTTGMRSEVDAVEVSEDEYEDEFEDD